MGDTDKWGVQGQHCGEWEQEGYGETCGMWGDGRRRGVRNSGVRTWVGGVWRGTSMGPGAGGAILRDSGEGSMWGMGP